MDLTQVLSGGDAALLQSMHLTPRLHTPSPPPPPMPSPLRDCAPMNVLPPLSRPPLEAAGVLHHLDAAPRRALRSTSRACRVRIDALTLSLAVDSNVVLLPAAAPRFTRLQHLAINTRHVTPKDPQLDDPPPEVIHALCRALEALQAAAFASLVSLELGLWSLEALHQLVPYIGRMPQLQRLRFTAGKPPGLLLAALAHLPQLQQLEAMCVDDPVIRLPAGSWPNLQVRAGRAGTAATCVAAGRARELYCLAVVFGCTKGFGGSGVVQGQGEGSHIGGLVEDCIY